MREVEALLAAREAKLAELTAERDRIRRAYQVLLEHYELLRRKLFVARAERVDATQLALEFAETKAKLDALAKVLGDGELEGPPAPADMESSASPPSDDEPKKTRKPKTTPTARRNLRDEDMPEKRIELLDPGARRHVRAHPLRGELPAGLPARRARADRARPRDLQATGRDRGRQRRGARLRARDREETEGARRAWSACAFAHRAHARLEVPLRRSRSTDSP